MVIFFFSLCLLLQLLLLLVLTGTDVNIHPIPHFQKSFPLKSTPLSLSPCATFCLPTSTLLPPHFFVPCSLSIKPPHFMDNRSKFPHSSMKLDIERKQNLVNLIKRQRDCKTRDLRKIAKR